MSELKGAPIFLLVDSSGIGGIERHVATLAAGLRERALDARILLLEDHGPNKWLSQLKAASLPYGFLDGGVLGLASYVRASGAGLLHTHGYKAGIIGRFAARLSGVPVVSTFHAGEIAAFPVSLYQRIDEITSCLASRISVSAPIAERLPFASEHIPNFVVAPDLAPTQPLPARIGFVGRLSLEKGPDIFCSVAAKSSAAASWEIFGDGPMQRELEAQYANSVFFHGMVTDMKPVWEKLGLLVISSRAEGLPMVALEAMAAGIPVVASAVGAIPDVVRHGQNGWLFEPEDSEALEQIIKLWTRARETEGARWRDCAWRTARDRFGVQLGVDKTLAVYRDAGYHLGAAFSRTATSQSSAG
ncbi:glycosyltransferase family 4 protein [Methylocystis echinoides]|uniref:Glycosyl transferase n=1 Tax=Methylocystis echinoides TaxID=29468 RepID=A0A9W6GXF3_9HYPH|nr:glycosyltransferase family 4 protein [Methylocystis echinoides]GLI94932.1 glycosyl transferase [Methylocystis echinoides]